MAPCAVNLLELRARLEELPQQAGALALQLRHDKIQERHALRRLQLAQLGQGVELEAIRAPSGGASVQVVAHLQDEAQQPLHAWGLLQALARAADLRLGRAEAVQQALERIEEGPRAHAELVLRHRHEQEHEGLGLVPGFPVLGPRGPGRLPQHRLLFGSGQVREQQLDPVGRQHCIVGQLHGAQQRGLLGHQREHEPDLPPPLLLEEAPPLGARPLRTPAAQLAWARSAGHRRVLRRRLGEERLELLGVETRAPGVLVDAVPDAGTLLGGALLRRSTQADGCPEELLQRYPGKQVGLPRLGTLALARGPLLWRRRCGALPLALGRAAPFLRWRGALTRWLRPRRLGLWRRGHRCAGRCYLWCRRRAPRRGSSRRKRRTSARAPQWRSALRPGALFP
mmetsp:Transcript_70163/g.194096  ORF Transcript_70163/g.194096 Transcript_70163/m.194096 type:complete len:397 (+) Transcript_70163:554-1744(+)